jgi:hypothetical protein
MTMTTPPDWLSPAARTIFDATLPKVGLLTMEKVSMLAAYSDAVVNLRRVKMDPGKARVWRGAMLYARNGLGFGNQVFIDFLDLLLDCGLVEELGVLEHLEESWQIERPDDYMASSLNF